MTHPTSDPRQRDVILHAAKLLREAASDYETKKEGVVGFGKELLSAADALALYRPAGPSGSFGYCATCYHPLDQCSHCDASPSEATGAKREDETQTVNRIISEIEAYSLSGAWKDMGALSVLQFALRLALRVGREQGAAPHAGDTAIVDWLDEIGQRVVQMGEGMPPVWKIGNRLISGKSFREAVNAERAALSYCATRQGEGR